MLPSLWPIADKMLNTPTRVTCAYRENLIKTKTVERFKVCCATMLRFSPSFEVSPMTLGLITLNIGYLLAGKCGCSMSGIALEIKSN